MIELLKEIVNSGIKRSDLYQNKRGVLISNNISLILSACFILTFILRKTVYGNLPNGINNFYLIVGLISFLLPLILNRLSFTIIGRIVLCFAPVCFLWSLFIDTMSTMEYTETSMYDSIRIYLIVFSVIPYLIFDQKKWLYLFLGITPSLVSIIFFEKIMDMANLGLESILYMGEDYQLMTMRTIIAYIILNLGSFLFQTIISRNDLYNQQILNQLKDKSDEIETQNEELTLSQEKLNELNLHLEDLVKIKTENIKIKNDKLLKYAHSNAHAVRGPVARLLGLIQLTKMETDLSYPLLFDKIENETQQIDDVIREISADLNDIDDL